MTTVHEPSRADGLLTKAMAAAVHEEVADLARWLELDLRMPR